MDEQDENHSDLERREFQRAERIEAEIKAKQPEGRRGCPFCGHSDIQTLVREVRYGEVMKTVLPAYPGFSGYPITLMKCQNCDFVMPFLERNYEDSE